MARQESTTSGSCPCSQGIDRRNFLKVTAMAGLLAGCSPVLETPAAAEVPTATAKPTLKPGQTEVPDFKGKKAVYILPQTFVAMQCHEASASVLEACGMSITLAASEKKPIPGYETGSTPLNPDVLIGEVNAADYDAVIFECGQPMETYNPVWQNLAREAVAQKKVLAAVCMMPAVLAAAGVLQGKQATSNINDQYALEQYGAVLSESNAVRDGKIVTASYEGADRLGWLIVEALTE